MWESTYIKNINGSWYAFAGSKNGNVYSIGNDCPSDGIWTARWTEGGVLYVASASPSRHAAYMKARRAGNYRGEA